MRLIFSIRFLLAAIVGLLFLSSASADDRVLKSHPGKTVLVTKSDPSSLTNLIVANAPAQADAVMQIFEQLGMPVPSIEEIQLQSLADRLAEPGVGLMVSSEDSAHQVLDPLFDDPDIAVYLFEPAIGLLPGSVQLSDGQIVGKGDPIQTGALPVHFIVMNGPPGTTLDAVLYPSAGNGADISLLFQMVGISVGSFQPLSTSSALEWMNSRMAIILDTTVLGQPAFDAIPKLFADPEIHAFRKSGEFTDVTPPLRQSAIDRLKRLEEVRASVPVQVFEPANLPPSAVKAVEYLLAQRNFFSAQPDTKWDSMSDGALSAWAASAGLEYQGTLTHTLLGSLGKVENVLPRRIGDSDPVGDAMPFMVLDGAKLGMVSLASGLYEPRLAGVSLRQCMQECAVNPRCSAVTVDNTACELFETFTHWFDWRNMPDVASAVVIQRGERVRPGTDHTAYAEEVLRSYEPPIQSELAHSGLPELPKVPGRATVSLDGFQYFSKPQENIRRRLLVPDNLSRTGGHPPAYGDLAWIVVSQPHASAIGEWVRSAEAGEAITLELEALFQAALDDAAARFGAESPVLAPILFDMAHLTTDQFNDDSGLWEEAESQRIALLRRSAQLLPFATPTGERSNIQYWHRLSVATLMGSLASDQQWYKDPANSSVEAYLKTRGGVCFEDATLNRDRSDAIIELVRADIDMFGILDEHIGWLRAAAACLEDPESAVRILSARVTLAMELSDDAIVAETLSDLALKQFNSGDTEGARASMLWAISRDLPRLRTGDLSAYLPNENANYHLLEQNPSLNSPVYPWQVLKPLGLTAEIDLLIAAAFSELRQRNLLDLMQRYRLLEFSRLVLHSNNTQLKSDVLNYLGQELGGFSEPSALGALVYIFNASHGVMADGNIELLEGGEAFLDTAPSDAVVAYQTARAAVFSAKGQLDTATTATSEAVTAAAGAQSRLNDKDLERLSRLIFTAQRELGDVTGLAKTIAAKLDADLQAVCRGRVSLKSFPWVPIDQLHDDPVLEAAFLESEVASDYIQCFERRRSSLNYRNWGADHIPVNRLLDVFYLLGAKNQRTQAEALMDTVLDKAFWQDDRGAESGGLEFATGAVIDGLLLAGKEHWLGGRSDVGLQPFKQGERIQDYEAALGRLGFSLDAIGRRDEATAIYEYLIALAGGSGSPEHCSEVYNACDFVSAFEAKYLGLEHGVADYSFLFGNKLFFAPEDFPLQAEFDPLERRRDGALAIWQHSFSQMDFAASLVATALYSPTGVPIESVLQLGDEITSDYAIRLLSVVAAQKLAAGDYAAATALSRTMIDSLEDRISGFAVFGDDPIVRQATRLRPLLETHLLAAVTDAEHRKGSVPEEARGDIFAAQIVQSSNTAASFAKFSARAFASSRPELRRLQDVTNQLNDKIGEFMVSPDKDPDLSDQIVALQAERGDLLAYLDDTDPELLGRASARLPTLDEIMGILRPREGLLFYYVASETTFAWLLTAEGVTSRRLEVSRSELETLVSGARASIDPEAQTGPLDLAALHSPYRALLQPFSDGLSDLETLIFVPSGPLNALPWAALLESPPTQATAERDEIRGLHLPWLLRSYELAQVPSLTAAHFLRTVARDDAVGSIEFFGLGRPDFGPGIVIDPDLPDTRGYPFTPLPETGEEIGGLARLYGANPERDILLDGNATEGRLREADLKNYRTLVFATHGVLSDEVPGLTEPALILAPGPAASSSNDDGILRSSEVLDLKLNAEIVILTACNTAGSNGLPGSEGLSGLTSSFFYAGARSLIVTHWKIPSFAATEYSLTAAYLKKNGRAPTWSGAIRMSALNMIDNSPGEEKAHPVNWGAYVFVGMP